MANLTNIGTQIPVEVAKGGTGVATTTAYAVQCGGTTATGAHQAVGVGTLGQLFTSNGPGALPSMQDAAADPVNDNTGFYLFSDYVEKANTLGYTFTGPNNQINSVAGHPGLMTATPSAGFSAGYLSQASLITMFFGSGSWIFETCIKTPDTLSDATDDYELGFGFRNAKFGTAQTDACYITYSHDINSGKWALITEDNSGGISTLDAGITVATSTWYKLRIEVNAAATSVEVFIDGVSKGTTSTNIPTTNNTLVMGLNYSVAGTPRIFTYDYSLLQHTLTTAR